MHNLVESIEVGSNAGMIPSFTPPSPSDVRRLKDDEVYEEYDNGQVQLEAETEWAVQLWDDESSISVEVTAPDADDIYIAGEEATSGSSYTLTLPGKPISDGRSFMVHVIADCHSEHYRFYLKTFRKHNVRLHTDGYYSRTRAKITGGDEERNLSQKDPYEHPKDVCITICNEAHPVYSPDGHAEYKDDIDYIENETLYGELADRPSTDDFLHWGLIYPQEMFESDRSAPWADIVPGTVDEFEDWMTYKGVPDNGASDDSKVMELIDIISAVDGYENKTIWFCIDDSGSTNTSDWEAAIGDAMEHLGTTSQITTVSGEAWLSPIGSPPSGDYIMMSICDESRGAVSPDYGYGESRYYSDVDRAVSNGYDQKDFHILQPGGIDPDYVGSGGIIPQGESYPAWLEKDMETDDVVFEDLKQMTENLMPQGGQPHRLHLYRDSSRSMTEIIDVDALYDFKEWLFDEYPGIHLNERMFGDERWVAARPSMYDAAESRIKLQDPDEGDEVKQTTRKVEHRRDIPGPLKVSVHVTRGAYTFVVTGPEGEPQSDATIHIWEDEEMTQEITGRWLFGDWWTGGPMEPNEEGRATIELPEGTYYYEVTSHGPRIRTRPPDTEDFYDLVFEGEMVSVEGVSSVDAFFEYTGPGANSPTPQQSISSPSTYTRREEDLEDNTPYSYRAVAKYTGGKLTETGSMVSPGTIRVRGLGEGSGGEQRVEGHWGRATTMDAPEGGNGGATNVTELEATLNGYMSNQGDASSVDVLFRFKEQGEDSWDVVSSSLNSDDTFDADMDDLKPGTGYVYMPVLQFSGEEVELPTISFTTEVPDVTTEDVSYVSETSAHVEGDISVKGDLSDWDVRFEWSGGGDHGTETAFISSFQANIYGLDPGTGYSVWAVAEANGKSFSGGSISFTTDESD